MRPDEKIKDRAFSPVHYFRYGGSSIALGMRVGRFHPVFRSTAKLADSARLIRCDSVRDSGLHSQLPESPLQRHWLLGRDYRADPKARRSGFRGSESPAVWTSPDAQHPLIFDILSGRGGLNHGWVTKDVGWRSLAERFGLNLLTQECYRVLAGGTPSSIAPLG